MDPSKLRKEFQGVPIKAKIRADLMFHSLRRTALAEMAANGAPVSSLQRIAGHSSIEGTAKCYLNVKQEEHDGMSLRRGDTADPPKEMFRLCIVRPTPSRQ